jgi:hypothetical protein
MNRARITTPGRPGEGEWRMADSGWAATLMFQWQRRDVSSQINEVMSVYRRYLPMCVAFSLVGVLIMAFGGSPRIITLGSFVALTGIIGAVLMKTWVHIKLSMLRIVWELRERRTYPSG